MRLKQDVILILILAGLLGSICIGIAIKGKSETEVPVVEEPEVEVIPGTFCKGINNADNIPQEVLDVVINYMDDYFESLSTLQLQDTSSYFLDPIEGEVSNNAIKLVVETRKLYDFDFTTSDAYYVLNVNTFYESDNTYHIEFLEDDSFDFKFLPDITSQCYDIENTIDIKKVGNEYKISHYDKVQGYYSMFSDNRNEDLNSIYNFYFKRLTSTIEDENYKKQLASQTSYTGNYGSIKYNRDSASKYAEEYCHTRNDKYHDFTDEGGNCQNFASQALVAGGMSQDSSGDNQWYFESYSDYTPSWVHVSSFSDYSKNNEGSGLVSDNNANIYYAEPGDLIQVGISSVSHTTVVSKVVGGHILLNSNSIDMKDFPLEAYTYPVRKLIKILGCNS